MQQYADLEAPTLRNRAADSSPTTQATYSPLYYWSCYASAMQYYLHRILLALYCLLYLASMPLSAEEQDKKTINVSWAAQLSTQYIWRGLEFGKGPTIFPQLNLSMGNFRTTLYGAYTLDGNHREVDICLAYTLPNLTIGLNDYYFVSPAGKYDYYFDYENKHYIELYATYRLPQAPLYLTLSNYIYGADKHDGRQAYSSYAELGYSLPLDKQSSLSFHIGSSLNRGFYTSYNRNFAISTIGLEYSRVLHLGTFSLPLSLSYSINPHKEKSYITLGITLQ